MGKQLKTEIYKLSTIFIKKACEKLFFKLGNIIFTSAIGVPLEPDPAPLFPIFLFIIMSANR